MNAALRLTGQALVVLTVLAQSSNYAGAAEMYAAAIGEPPHAPRTPAPAKKPAEPAPSAPTPPPAQTEPTPPETTATAPEEEPMDPGMRNKILIGAAVALGLAALGGGGGGGGGGEPPPQH